MRTANSYRNILFISYAREDRELCSQLAGHLTRRADTLGYEVWFDRAIQSGRTWRPQLAEKIELTGACILLASLEALESDFIWEKEIRAFLAAGVPVSPLYARYFDWEGYPHVADLAFIEPPGTQRPLESLAPQKVGEVLAEISRSLGTWLPALTSSGGADARLIGTGGDRRGASQPAFEPGALVGVPALPQDYQERADLLAQFKEGLLSEGPGSRAITGVQTLGLHGSGGTGKSVMAAALVYDEEVRQAFPDGVYWVTVGEERRNIEVRQQQLAGWLGCEISYCRTNRDRREALAQALEGRRCLIVVDDVWSAPAAVALDLSGPLTRVLYTTRHENLLSHPELRARPLVVSRYDAREALGFLARATAQDLPLPPDAERVAFFTSGVVLSLSLAAGAFRHGLGWGDLARRFEESSSLYPEDLDGNLRAMRVGLSMLNEEEVKRYCDLVVFPRDTLIPIGTIDRFWRYMRVEHPVDLLVKFELSGLLHRDGDFVRFHDDQLFYLQANAPSQVGRHADLLESFRTDTGSWSDLDPAEPYMWDHLVNHLTKAMEMAEAEALASDMAWISRRWWLSGAGAVEHDLALLSELLSEWHRAQRLRRRLSQGAHLMTGLTAMAEIANTLAILTIDIMHDTGQLRALVDGAWLEPSTPSATGSDALVKVFSGHKGAVNAVVGVSVAGRRRVASGGSDATVRIWDELAPDSESMVLAAHRGAVRKLCPVVLDGIEWLASAGDDRRILLWDIADLHGAPLELQRHTSGVLALSATESSDTFFLASGGEDRTVRLWYKADPQRPPLVLRRHTAPVVAIAAAASAHGLLLATASRDGKRIMWCETRAGVVEPIAFRSDHPNTRAGVCLIQRTDVLVAASSSLNNVVLRDAVEFEVPVGSVGPLAASVNVLDAYESHAPGGFVIGCADGGVHKWDWSMPFECVQSFFGHTGSVLDVCALESDRLRIASASDDGSARVWDPSLGSEPTSGSDTRTSRLTAIAVLGGGGRSRLATATADRRAVAWEHVGVPPKPLFEHHITMRAMHSFSALGRTWLTVGDENGQAWIADLSSSQQAITQLPGAHVGPIRALTSVVSQGRWFIASAGHDRQVRMRTHNGDEEYVLRGQHSNRILDIKELTSDGVALLVTASADGTVRYWDPIDTRSSTRVVELGRAQINSICPLKVGGVPWLAAGSDDGDIECWCVNATERRTRLARSSAESVASLAWIPVGEEGLLAVLTVGGILELWNVADGAMHARVRLGDRGLTVAAAATSETLVVAYDAAWMTLRI